MKSALVLVASVLGGMILGLNIGGEPEVKYRLVEKPIVETEVITEYVAPDNADECKELEQLARDIAANSREFSDKYTFLVEMHKQTRLAVAREDSNKITEIENKVRKSDSNLTDADLEMSDLLSRIDTVASMCYSPPSE